MKALRTTRRYTVVPARRGPAVGWLIVAVIFLVGGLAAISQALAMAVAVLLAAVVIARAWARSASRRRH